MFLPVIFKIGGIPAYVLSAILHDSCDHVLVWLKCLQNRIVVEFLIIHKVIKALKTTPKTHTTVLLAKQLCKHF